MNASFNTGPGSKAEERRQRALAIASIDAMIRKGSPLRPLKPPPIPRQRYAPSAGALELAREIREGTYVPGGRFMAGR